MKKGKWFENKIKSSMEYFFPREKIKGETSYLVETGKGKWNRKVDVSIGDYKSKDFVIIECKDKKKYISSIDMDQCIQTKKELNAKNCYLFTNCRIPKPQLNRANANDIKLMHLVDTSDLKLKTSFSISVVHNFYWISKIRQKSYFCGQLLNYDGHPNNIVEETNNVSLLNIISELWNNRSLRNSEGLHSFTLDFHLWRFVENGVIVPADKTIIEYEVTRKSYINQFPLINGKGVYVVQKKQFISISDTLCFGPIKIEKITQGRELKELTNIDIESLHNIDCYYHM